MDNAKLLVFVVQSICESVIGFKVSGLLRLQRAILSVRSLVVHFIWASEVVIFSTRRLEITGGVVSVTTVVAGVVIVNSALVAKTPLAIDLTLYL